MGAFDQTFFHSEVNTWRAVTGSSYNIRGVYGSTLPAKGTIPFYIPIAGTITSGPNRMILGSGTTFLTSNIKVGDFIYAVDVVRRVKAIISDTLLELEYDFPAAVTNQPLRVCKANAFRMVYAKSTGAAAVTKLQEAPLAVGCEANFSAPVSYDATAGEISFTIND